MCDRDLIWLHRMCPNVCVEMDVHLLFVKLTLLWESIYNQKKVLLSSVDFYSFSISVFHGSNASCVTLGVIQLKKVEVTEKESDEKRREGWKGKSTQIHDRFCASEMRERYKIKCVTCGALKLQTGWGECTVWQVISVLEDLLRLTSLVEKTV